MREGDCSAPASSFAARCLVATTYLSSRFSASPRNPICPIFGLTPPHSCLLADRVALTLSRSSSSCSPPKSPSPTAPKTPTSSRRPPQPRRSATRTCPAGSPRSLSSRLLPMIRPAGSWDRQWEGGSRLITPLGRGCRSWRRRWVSRGRVIHGGRGRGEATGTRGC